MPVDKSYPFFGEDRTRIAIGDAPPQKTGGQSSQLPAKITDETGGLRRGRVSVVNDRQTIANAGVTGTFTFQMPSVAVCYIVEMTYDVVSSMDLHVTTGTIDPALLQVTQINFQRAGTSESANIVLAGQPTVKECFGDGRLPRLLTRVVELNPHQQMTIVVKNNAAASATISISLWLETSAS